MRLVPEQTCIGPGTLMGDDEPTGRTLPSHPEYHAVAVGYTGDSETDSRSIGRRRSSSSSSSSSSRAEDDATRRPPRGGRPPRGRSASDVAQTPSPNNEPVGPGGDGGVSQMNASLRGLAARLGLRATRRRYSRLAEPQDNAGGADTAGHHRSGGAYRTLKPNGNKSDIELTSSVRRSQTTGPSSSSSSSAPPPPPSVVPPPPSSHAPVFMTPVEHDEDRRLSQHQQQQEDGAATPTPPESPPPPTRWLPVWRSWQLWPWRGLGRGFAPVQQAEAPSPPPQPIGRATQEPEQAVYPVPLPLMDRIRAAVRSMGDRASTAATSAVTRARRAIGDQTMIGGAAEPPEPGDDPTHQQLIFFGGIFLGPILFALGGFLFFLTPREFKRTRMVMPQGPSLCICCTTVGDDQPCCDRHLRSRYDDLFV